MTDLQMWTLITGALLPPVIAILQQPKFRNGLRAFLTGAVCCAVGFVTVYIQGDLSGKRIVSAILTVAVAALSTYQGFWKPSGIAPAIEKATAIG